jgi:hypothetical protein
MSRKPLLIALASLAVLALVLHRRRARPAAPAPAPNGPPDDSRESLRRFVEAGERMHEGGQARSEL